MNFRLILLWALFLCCSGSVFAQIEGTVTCGGKPMSGVAVSDGKEVVETDKNGVYRLPENKQARFVFVTKPTSYKTVGRHYVAVGGGEYNFVLEKNPTELPGQTFSFIHITDTETFLNKTWIDNITDWVKTHPTAFVIHTGDICYERGLNFHGNQVRAEQLGTDMFYCVGNHDLVKGAYGEQLWERNFGPAWYSFDVGNVHFMVLPMLSGDYAPSYTKDQIVKWMKKDLATVAADKKVVMFNHDLWFQGNDLLIKTKSDTLDMAKHNLVAFFYGHWHSHYVRPVAGMMTYSSSTPDKGGIDHGVSAFRVINVSSDGKIESFSRYTGIASQLVPLTPTDKDKVVLKNGQIAVAINCYRSISAARMVRVGWEDAGNVKRWVQLFPKGDWSWCGVLPGKVGVRRMVAEAIFDDGTRLVKRIDVDVCTQDTASTLLWHNHAEGNILMVAPVESAGKIITATTDDDNLRRCFVVAFDSKTGAEAWRFKTDNSVKNAIVADSERVVACDADGNVYALSSADGKLLWRNALRGGILPQVLQGLALDGTTLYAGQGRGFCAIDVRDGSVLWQNDAWGGGEGTTSVIKVGEGIVLASAHWNGLFAHDARTGKLLWKRQDGETRFRDGSPTFYKGLIYLATSSTLMILDPRTGDVIKSAKCDESFNNAGAPLVTDKAIYVATSNKGVAAYDPQTLKKLWGHNTSPSLFYTVPYAQDYECSVEQTPLLYGDILLFGASDGILYGVDIKTGSTVIKRNIGSPLLSSLLATDRGVVASDFAGNIFKIKMSR